MVVLLYTHLHDDDQLLSGPLEPHGRVLRGLTAGLHELGVGVRVVQLQGVDAPHVVPARDKRAERNTIRDITEGDKIPLCVSPRGLQARD